MIKHLYLIVIAFFCGFVSTAQTPVTVNSTGGVTTSASYPDLKTAFDTINSGYQTGVITIWITGNVTQATTARLDSSGRVQAWGTSSYTSVTISPSGGTWTVSGAIAAGSALIHLNGADNVTIDGLNNGTDSLIISNTTASATSGTSTLLLSNDASNNTVRKTTLLGAATMSTTTNGGTVFISTAASTGNDNNVFSNCFFAQNNATNTNFPYKHIYINGTTTSSATANNGIVIDSNKFVNFRANGVYANTGVRDLTISNNHFYHTATLASSAIAFAPILVSNATTGIGENFNIYRNYIGGSAPFCGGSKPSIALSNVFQTIYLNCATSAYSYINGNTIANMSITTNSTTINHSFFYINGGKVSCGSQEGNVIGSMTDTGSLVMIYSGSSSTNFAVFCSAGSNTTPTFDSLLFENNKFGGFTLRPSTGTSGQNASLRVFDPTGATGTFVIRNNTIGSPTVPNSIKQYTTGNSLIGLLNRSSSTAQHIFKRNYIGNLTHFATGTGSNTSGISITNATSWIVDSNTIENITSYTASIGVDESSQLTAIAFRPSGTLSQSLIGNTVRNLIFANPTAKTNIIGISLGGSAANIVAGNKVLNLYSLSADTSTIVGIRANFGVTNTVVIHNNEVILGLDSAGNNVTRGHAFYGLARVRGNTNIYHNSVYLGGTGVTQGANTYAMFTTDTGGTRDFRNNVFSNERSFALSGTAKNYAAWIAGVPLSGTIAGLTCNYNLYYAPNIGGMLITNAGLDYASVPAWNSFAAAHDNFSIQGNPLFVSNRRLQGQPGTAITVGDASAGILIDITGATRVSYLMGAYDANTPLPVKYYYFKGQHNKEDVVLQWSTASEIWNKGFSVERSVNGTEFTEIAFVHGMGSSAKLQDYQLTDAAAFVSNNTNILYYRLKQEDFNGRYTYSNTITLSLISESSSELEVYPNPFKDEATFHLSSDVPQTTVISVTDVFGKELIRQQVLLSMGDNQFNISDLRQLPAGFYLICSDKFPRSQSIKVLKQ